MAWRSPGVGAWPFRPHASGRVGCPFRDGIRIRDEKCRLMRDNPSMKMAVKHHFHISALLGFLLLPICPLLAQAPEPANQKPSEAYDAGMRLLREKRYAEALEQFQQEEKIAPQLPQGAMGQGIAL